MNKEALAKLVRNERDDMPRHLFAKLLGVSEGTLYRIEHGVVSPNSVKKIAKYFNMTISEVLDVCNEQK